MGALTVEDGQIVAVDSCGSPWTQDIDIDGRWLLPGAIDGHVHFDDPGYTHREDFASGTLAAAAGGVTTVVDMPCTSVPPVTDSASLSHKLRCVGPKANVDFACWGGVRGNDFDATGLHEALRGLRSLGVRSIKTYLLSGMSTFADLSREQLREVMRVARGLDLLVGVHAEDREMVRAATQREQGLRGCSPIHAYMRARSTEAELRAVQTCVELAEETGARVHVVHLACGEGVDLVRKARSRGISISAETCPHYLAFTCDDLVRLGSVLKTAPVVKSGADRQALWDGLADGTLEMVATDHAPAAWPEEKQTGSVWTDYGGVPGVELLVPFLLSEGVHKGRITLQRALELLCSGPSRVHRLMAKGRLEPGADADCVVFDPGCTWEVHADALTTRQKYTPFEGAVFHGCVTHTYLRGQLVYARDRGFVFDRAGRYVAG